MIGKDFLSLNDYNNADMRDFLAVAHYLKTRAKQGVREAVLTGQTLAMIFEKPSLRTRVSFEVGMTQLGGSSMFIRGEEVGLNTREPA
ncbi:MAG: ornithine carbamoyltransferase, partial [Planctomycetes bacterium]|nr:ornithine carbamoyltransferase [Planctomycetota bacterium]